MESTHPELASHFLAYHAGYTLLHLASRLIGESERKDIPGRNAILEQVGNPVG